MSLKLFTDKSGELTRLQSQPFESEKEIQTMIEENLSNIFPNLEFLKTEFTVDDGRSDTIAFNNKKNCFVVIEYKNKKDKSVLEQIGDYYTKLKDQPMYFVLLYNKIKNKQCDKTDFNWDDAYAIYISSVDFTKRQLNASKYLLPISLFQIYRDDQIITLETIHNDQNDDSDVVISPNPSKEYTEDVYLNDKDSRANPSDVTRSLYFHIKKTLQEKFDNIEVKGLKTSIIFHIKDTRDYICTVDIKSKFINLTFSTKIGQGVITELDCKTSDNFITDVSDIGIFGNGNYQSKIFNESDFAKALPFIEKIYNDKLSN